MEKILLIDENKSQVQKLLDFLRKKYTVEFDSDIFRHLEDINSNPLILVLLGSEVYENVPYILQKHRALLKNKVILVNHGRPMDYILDCFKHGALNSIESNFNDSEVLALVELHFNSSKTNNKFASIAGNIQLEIKELELKNQEIYDSVHIDIILEYLMRSIKSIATYDLYIGLMNSVYEILINAMEHGNLGINSQTKEELLLDRRYDQFLSEALKSNDLKVFIHYQLKSDNLLVKVKDEGKGFDYHQDYNKGHLLSGRGISIAKYFFDEVIFSEGGCCCTLKKKFPPKEFPEGK